MTGNPGSFIDESPLVKMVAGAMSEQLNNMLKDLGASLGGAGVSHGGGTPAINVPMLGDGPGKGWAK